jgi:A/G-specific adenine glycosylase
VASTCVARAQGDALAYPVRTRKLKRRSQSLWMLWLRAANGDVWLTRRPAQGIWGGLYCFPMFDSDQDLLGAVPKRWHKDIQLGPVVPHVLTHRDLYLHPCVLSLAPPSEAGRGEWGEGRWVPPQEWSDLGLPAPIRKLLLATGSGP